MSKTTNRKVRYHSTEDEIRQPSKKVQMAKPPKNHRWIDEVDDFDDFDDDDFEDFENEEE